MNKNLFKAACKMMLEIVKLKDTDTFLDYFDYLNDAFSYEDVMAVVNKTSVDLYNKDDEVYQWLLNQIEALQQSNSQVIELEGEIVDIYVCIADIIHVLLDEGKLPLKDFISHPTNPDKILVTQSTYDLLVNLYGEDSMKQMTEIGELK